MESGLNNSQPLLSIAIPTWNRAKQLDIALSRLLTDIKKYSNLIELVVCDNASEDDTQEVIRRVYEENKEINLVSFAHPVNTGFYGNFTKCISLVTGKYVWILSDDDFVFEGVIDTLIDILSKKELEIGAVFLDDWTSDEFSLEKHTYDVVDLEEFFKIGNYRHTLISSVIYAHKVFGDDKILEDLKGNALIAYPVFLKAVTDFKQFAILKGNALLKTNDEEVRFDALGIFTLELAECLKIGYQYLPKRVIDFVANMFICTLINTHFQDFKYRGKYKNKQNESLSIFKYYVKYKNFWLYIFPLILLSEERYLKVKKAASHYLKSK